MYLEHFGLLEAPFSIAPDPRYLYMSERHREALAHLIYGMESDGAFILLTGDVGTGKTTVSRCLLGQVPENTNLALVLNPKLTSIELLQVICDELHIIYEKTDLSVKALVDYINRNLLEAHAQGKKTVVLIEEAQNLDLDVLEQLRLLTNLETNERKLLQVILLGQPEFLDVLDRPELSQLAQRITARFHLGPLKQHEVEEYTAHRLAIAGCRRPLFPHAVIKQLFNYSGGVPRLINVICDRALLGCYVQNKHQVDKKILMNAAKEVLGDKKTAAIKANVKPKLYKIYAIAVVVIMLMTAAYLSGVRLELASSVNKIDADIVEVQKLPQVKAEQITVEQVDIQAEDVPQEEPVVVDPVEAELLAVAADSKEAGFIKWPDRGQRLRSNLQSYQSLFDSWQLDYNILTNGTPCFFAETKGLSCLHERSDLQSLLQYNRPAVLTLYDDLNRRQYVALIELNEESAKIVMAGGVQKISLEQLIFYWKGEFSLLWRTPPEYKDLIRPGDSSKLVLWLSERMNEINHNPQDSVHSYYDRELVEQIKAFQLREGLEADGVVGVKTLIHINQVTGEKVPLLGTS